MNSRDIQHLRSIINGNGIRATLEEMRSICENSARFARMQGYLDIAEREQTLADNLGHAIRSNNWSN